MEIEINQQINNVTEKEKVVKYPSFPEAEQKMPTVPELDHPTLQEIRDQSLKSMVKFKKKSYWDKDKIMEEITKATEKGKSNIKVPSSQTKYKVLKFYTNLGYKCKKSKKKNLLKKIFGVEEIIISWK